MGILWPETGTQVQSKKISVNSPEAETLVNKHLWLTNHSKEIAQERAKAQNAYLAPQIGDSVWPIKTVRGKDLGVDHSADTNETNAYEDLNRYQKEFNSTNPDAIIQGQIVEQQVQRQYQEKYRAEYARQFIENARMNGYEVKLDKDYMVISVTPLPNAQSRNPSLFDGTSKPQAQ